MRPLYIGACLLIVSTAVKVWAYVELKRAGIVTDWQHAGPSYPDRWTQSGPYAITDHPVYWSLLASIASIGIMAFGWAGAVLAVPAWPYFRQRMVQEDLLRADATRRAVEGGIGSVGDLIEHQDRPLTICWDSDERRTP